MNERVVSESSDTMADTIDSCTPPVKQQEPRYARSSTVVSDIPPVEPREHRRPNRPGIVWTAGSRLEARDFLNKWYAVFNIFVGRTCINFIVSEHLRMVD